MKTSCNTIYDLLPLYVDEICSEDSRNLIEEHLKECSSCRAKHKAMSSSFEVDTLDTLKSEIDDSTIDNFNAKKAFIKIRRRWVASILIMILMLPIFYLGINQCRGEGVSFTNIYSIYKTNSMLAAFEKGDFEKMFSYLDVDKVYKDIMRDIDWANPLPSKDDFELLEIEGEGKYYINTQLHLEIPEEDFEEAFAQMQEEQIYYLNWLSQFEGMSYEEFHDLCKKSFIENMNEWEAMGAPVTGCRFKSVYNIDGASQIEFLIHFSHNGKSDKFGLAFISGEKGKLRLVGGSNYSPDTIINDELLHHLLRGVSIYPQEDQ